MKVYVQAKRQRISRTANVYKVIEAMNWNKPTFMDKGRFGYICKWGGVSFKDRKLRDELRYIFRSRYNIDIRSNYPDYHYPKAVIAEELGIPFEEAQQLFFDVVQECMPQIEAMLNDTLNEIKDKTGIECKFTRQGNLIIPYAD